jgi:predicted ATPase
MINSIKFPKTGKGYIYKKFEMTQAKPEPHDWKYRGSTYNHETGEFKDKYDTKRYEEDLAAYEEELKFYNEHKGQYCAGKASSNLIGHEFRFTPGVNIIFGPNGSGKTTILKALAGNALCTDGFSALIEPLDLVNRDWGEDPTLQNVIDTVAKMRMNTCNINWTGNPIYFDNFCNRQSYGSLGDLVGSVLDNDQEELSWILGKQQISAGQQTKYLVNKILHKLEANLSLKELTAPYLENKRLNDVWKKSYRACIDYLAQRPDFEKKGAYTLIFDEMDKSLDVETVIDLYQHVLPSLHKRYGCQIITVSHSPILTAPYFRKNGMYNIIDMDPEYTSDVTSKMNALYNTYGERKTNK